MKLETMNEFLRLAKTGNYTKAAADLYISQSALSRHIAALEREIGIQLIHYPEDRFELTPAGEIVRDGFKEVLGSYSALLERLDDYAKGIEGELTLGILSSDNEGYAYEIVSAFRKQYPNIKLFTRFADHYQLMDEIGRGELDAALCSSLFADATEGIDALPFIRVPMAVVMTNDDPLCEKELIEPRDISGRMVLVFKDGEHVSFASQVRSFLASEGVQPAGYVEISDFNDFPYVLNDHRCLSIVPDYNTTLWRNQVQVRPFDAPGWQADFSAYWREDNSNAALPLLKEIVRSIYG